MSDDPWYFPRTELAERTVFALTGGPSKALTLFAPRRMGKTEFLIKDVAPAVEKAGHSPVYVSFWEQPIRPLGLLVEALEAALSQKSPMARAAATFRRVSPRLKLSAEVPGTGMGGEIDLSDIPKKAEPHLIAHMNRLLERLAGRKGKTVLLLDEVQELALRAEDEGLIAALRTSLDVSPHLRTIFTGSSAEGLRLMFSDRAAPFFHFGTQIDLEPLGDDFVDHLIAQLKTLTDRSVERDRLVALFAELGRSPYHMRGIFEQLVLRRDLGVDDAIRLHYRKSAEARGFSKLWLGFKPTPRHLLAMIAEGWPKPFSEDFLQELSSRTGRKESQGTVQAAIRLLVRSGQIDRRDREIRLLDDEFGRWLAGENEAPPPLLQKPGGEI